MGLSLKKDVLRLFRELRALNMLSKKVWRNFQDPRDCVMEACLYSFRQ